MGSRCACLSITRRALTAATAGYHGGRQRRQLAPCQLQWQSRRGGGIRIRQPVVTSAAPSISLALILSCSHPLLLSVLSLTPSLISRRKRERREKAIMLTKLLFFSIYNIKDNESLGQVSNSPAGFIFVFLAFFLCSRSYW